LPLAAERFAASGNAANNIMKVLGIESGSFPHMEAFRERFILGWGGYPIVGTPEQAVETLSSSRGAEVVTDSMIAHALGTVSSPESANRLTERESGATGPLRREIRRALFKLRQYGIEVPESTEASRLDRSCSTNANAATAITVAVPRAKSIASRNRNGIVASLPRPRGRHRDPTGAGSARNR